MVHIRSATPLDEVVVEGHGPVSDVWLRMNITYDIIETQEGTREVWEADETHGILPGTPTVAEVETDFDALWERFERVAKSADDYLDEVAAMAERTYGLLAYVAMMVDVELPEVDDE